MHQSQAKTRCCQVIGHYIPSQKDELVGENQERTGTKELSFGKGKIFASIWHEAKVFQPGETIPFIAHIENNSTNTITKYSGRSVSQLNCIHCSTLL